MTMAWLAAFSPVSILGTPPSSSKLRANSVFFPEAKEQQFLALVVDVMGDSFVRVFFSPATHHQTMMFHDTLLALALPFRCCMEEG